VDLAELLRFARRALERGADPEAVDARIEKITDGMIPNVDSLARLAGGVSLDTTDPTTFQGGTPGPVQDFIRSLAQGATFGFADELYGLGERLTAPRGERDEAQRRATAASRENLARIREERPVASLLGEMAGGAAVPLGSGMGIGRAVLARTGSRLAAGLLGGAAGGGMGGALVGAGEADEGSRTAGAVAGGAIGAPAGAVVGAAGGLLGNLAGRAGIASRQPADYARTQLRRGLREADIPIEDVVSRLRGMPEGSVVADMAPNLGREARGAVNQSSALVGPGGPVRTLERRAGERGERLARDLRSATGLQRSFDESMEAAEQAYKYVSETMYQPLERAHPKVSDPRVLEVLSDPRVMPVVRKVDRRLARRLRVPEELAEAPPEAIARFRASQDIAPTFRQLQDIRGHLRDAAKAAHREGKNYARDQAFEALDRVNAALEEALPGFREANRAAWEATQRIGAHELGQKAATGRKPPREIMRALEELPTDEARDAFRQGMLDQIERNLRERAGGGSEALKMITGGDTMMDRLRLLVGSDEGMAELLSGIEREVRWSRTWNALAGNSTTAQQAADILAQVPTTKRDAFMRVLGWVTGLNAAERRQAADILGRVLLEDGEEAARLLAQDMALRGSTSGAVGAAAGTEVARRAVRGGGF